MNISPLNLPQSDLQFLAQVDFFNGISSNLVPLLVQDHEIKKFSHHQTIFEEGEKADFFYLIIDGFLKLTKSFLSNDQKLKLDFKKESIVSISRKDDFIGLLLMSKQNALYPVTMTSLGETLLLKIPQKTYLQEWVKHPEVVTRTQQIVYNRSQSFHFALSMNHLNLEKKVLHFLSQFLVDVDLTSQPEIKNYLSQEFQLKENVHLPITRKEIANMLGANCESVIRIMSGLEKCGTIKTKKGVIEIIEPQQLLKMLKS